DLFGSYFQTDMHFKNKNMNKPLFLPSDSTFDMRIPSIDKTKNAQALHMIILQDSDFYTNIVEIDAIHDQFSPIIRPPGIIGFDRLINDIKLIPPYSVVHAYFGNSTYHNKIDFHNIMLITQPTLPCFDQTNTLKPDITLIPAPPLEISP